MPTEVVAFFLWLASNAGVGAVMSEFFESEAWFKELSKQSKNRLVLVVSIALGILAWFVSTKVSPELIAWIQPIASIIIAAITVYLTSQRYHDTARKEIVQTNVKMEVKTEVPPDTTTSSDVG